MNNWYMKSLGDGMWAPMACAEIEEKFQPMFESVGKPITMAVLSAARKGMCIAKSPRFFLPPRGGLLNRSAHRHAPLPRARDWNYWRGIKIAGRRYSPSPIYKIGI